MPRTLLLYSLVFALLAALIASAFEPIDRTTWLLEVSPLVALLPLFLYLHRRAPMSTLAYVLLATMGIGLTIGAHYGFAHVPAGFWIRDAFGLERNPYDRIGHVLQGIVPAIIAREWLLRHQRVRGERLLPLLCVSIALSVSAVYELAEWVAALILGQGAEEFLGMQGDEWDTQADMACALFGAIVAMTVLVPLHNWSMNAIPLRNGSKHDNPRSTAAMSRARSSTEPQ
jgi:putative membrane protein